MSIVKIQNCGVILTKQTKKRKVICMSKGKREQKRALRRLNLPILLLLVSVAGIAFGAYLRFEHFDLGTTINGVDCSFCTPEEAKERLEQVMNTSLKLYTMLPDGDIKLYDLTEEEIQTFEIKAPDVEVFEEMRNIQKQEPVWKRDQSKRTLTIEGNPYTVNKEAVREYLETVPELSTNMVKPQNAYLKIGDDDRLEIEPHVCGNELDFEEAFEYTVNALEAGENEVFLSEITKTEPDILVTDKSLQNAQRKINQVLDSVIRFILPDGTSISLDVEIMKHWVTENPDGSFTIDVEENLWSFVELLDQKVTEASSNMVFKSTGTGDISFSLPVYAKQVLDQETQVAKIKEVLYEGKETTMDLCLKSDPLSPYRNCKSYIELDITRQKLWLYVNGECILNGVDVVTGDESKNHGTPTGIYFLTYKARDVTLTDHKTYWSFVKYWMPFNGGIGFHDASWRYGIFGGEIYLTNGSHGCVNMAEDDAATLYQYINTEMPIFIYAS